MQTLEVLVYGLLVVPDFNSGGRKTSLTGFIEFPDQTNGEPGGITMSATTSRPNQLSHIGVRERRLDNANHLNLQLFVNNFPCLLKNISDTGMAFTCEEDFEVHTEGMVKIVFSSEQKIEFKGRFVWKREEGTQTIYGFHFNYQYLPEGFLEALDKMTDIKENLDKALLHFTGLDLVFKQITFDIKFFLETTKAQLDHLENEILVQSENVRNAYREVIKSNFEITFVEKLKSFSKSLDQIFSQFKDKEVKRRHIEFFRSQVGIYYTQNPFIGRALRKPRGYAGDFEMMNQIYRSGFEGRTFFEMLMHRYGVMENSSQSVKYRRDYLVRKIFEQSKGKKQFSFCSLACGPAKEVIKFLQEVNVEESAKYTIALLDQDVEALLNAKRNVYEQVLARNLKCQIYFLPISVKQILEQHEESQVVSKIQFDLIYTAGLYDYLAQPVAQLLTRHLLSWLKPGSEMIIGNFHPGNPTKTISELVADWKLIHRSEEDMMNLISLEKVASSHLHRDQEGIDLFLEIKV